MRMLYVASVALAGLMGCASFQERPVSELKVDNPRISWSAKRYTGSEEEAITRMMDQAVTSDQEDAWLEYTVDGKTHFADIGKYAGVNKMVFRNSSTGEVVVEIDQKNISPDLKRLWGLLSSLPAGTKVRHYHIHPLGEQNFKYRKGAEFVADLNTFPSAQDFTMDLQTRVLGEKYAPQVEILSSRVVGVRGYSEFYTTEQDLGIPEISPDDEETLRGIEFDIGFRHASQATILTPETTLEKVREGLNENGLKVTYTVLRDVPEKVKEMAENAQIQKKN